MTIYVKGDKLLVSGCEGDKTKTEGDYSFKEFKRSFDLPKNIETDKLASFITNNGMLIIEFPIKKALKSVFPKILDVEGKKSVELDLSIPDNVDPNKVSVTCKDRDLIVRADYKVQKPDGFSKIHYLRRTTLPENTDFNSLKCVADKNDLKITAPLLSSVTWRKQIPVPIQYK
jgi:HSP20 family molecular chaperone IbpA